MGNTKDRFTRGYGLLEGSLARKRARIANEMIPPHSRKGRILDFGCGRIPFFLRNTPFNEKYGMDPHVQISVANGNIRLMNIDINNTVLPFGDNFFDVVTMLAVFEHIVQANLTTVLKEFGRVLKPDGRLIMTTPCPWSDKLLRLMAASGLVSPEEIKDHKGVYGRKMIKNYLVRSGFEVHKIRFGYFQLFLNSWVSVDK